MNYYSTIALKGITIWHQQIILRTTTKAHKGKCWTFWERASLCKLTFRVELDPKPNSTIVSKPIINSLLTGHYRVTLVTLHMFYLEGEGRIKFCTTFTLHMARLVVTSRRQPSPHELAFRVELILNPILRASQKMSQIILRIAS